MRWVPEAGAIAARLDGPEPLFLLVSARKSKGNWIFPKGHLEKGETHEQAALRELHEEAGVTGSLASVVGRSRYWSGKERVEVTYFLVLATGHGIPGEGRQLRWHPFTAARAALTFEDARELLDRARELLPKPS